MHGVHKILQKTKKKHENCSFGSRRAKSNLEHAVKKRLARVVCQAAENPVERRGVEHQVVRHGGPLNGQRHLHGVRADLARERQQQVVETRHEMVAYVRRDEHSDAAEVAASVRRDQRVADASRHRGEPDQRPAVLIRRQERVALQDRRLHVEPRQQLANGRDLKEPVPARLLRRLRHLHGTYTRELVHYVRLHCPCKSFLLHVNHH